MVWGQQLYADATQVDAHASLAALAPRCAIEAHLRTLFGTEAATPAAETGPPCETGAPPSLLPVPLSEERRDDLAGTTAARHDWIAQAGRPQRDVTPGSYQRVSDVQVSTTDADATPMRRKGGGATPITTTTSYDPDGNTLNGTTQSNDANGQPQVATDTSSVNPTDWLTSTVDSAPGVVPLTTTYGYDAGGNQRSESILNGAATITTTYDANNRPTSISENAGGSPYTNNFAYDMNDQPLTATLANTVQETRRYDANSRLTHLGALGPGGVSTPLTNAYDYGYNAAGLTTQISTTLSGVAGTETITHDALGRVTGDNGGANGPETWCYDKNGNFLSNLERGATTVFTYSVTQPNQELSQHTHGHGIAYWYGCT